VQVSGVRVAKSPRMRSLRLPLSSLVRIVGAAVLLGSLVPSASVALVPGDEAECAFGTGVPETGLQGEVPLADQISGRALDGYRCGIDVVGHHDLGGQQYNANMAWVDDCAYVATAGSGVSVVDVTEPHEPTVVTTLNGPTPLDRPQDWGTDFALETLAAWESNDPDNKRAFLAIGRYGNPPAWVRAPMDLYDVRDCDEPKLLGTYSWPTNIHNLTFSPDGARIWATLPLQAIDISAFDPDDVETFSEIDHLGDLEDDLQADAEDRGNLDERWRDEFLSHEALEVDEGGRSILYLGGQTPLFDTFSIIDVTDWVTGSGPAEVLSQQDASRGHSVRTATIDGETYVLHSEESVADPTAKGCVPAELNPVGGAAQPYLTKVERDDEGSPTGIDQGGATQFRLEINEPEHCATQIADRMNSSVHYHDVDDPQDTSFALLSMWNSGLRIVDVRPPTGGGTPDMAEVAYFNPGAIERIGGDSFLDVAWGHVRYQPDTGEIWLVTARGGFWVLRLQPAVYDRIGLAVPSAHIAPPAEPVTRTKPFLRQIGAAPTAAYYCTLDTSTVTAAGAVTGVVSAATYPPSP